MMSENGWFLRQIENGDGESDDELLDGMGCSKKSCKPTPAEQSLETLDLGDASNRHSPRKPRVVPLGHVALFRSMVGHRFLIIFSMKIY